MKSIFWFSNTLEELISYPAKSRRVIGYSLRRVQNGDTPENVKTFKGAVQEIRVWGPDNDYRVYYVANLNRAVYVLHAMVKRTSSGIAVSTRDRDLILKRYNEAKIIDRE